MSVVAVVLVVGAATWFVLRCTVLAPATGRHSLTPHRGWEGRTTELNNLTEKPGRHTQRIKTCGHPHPDDPRVTCTLPAHHSGDDHEQRFSAAIRRTWSGTTQAA